METSLTSFREQLRESLLAFLWRQWSALGVSGNAKTGDEWLIDPEALVLFSTVVARHDARLFDEVIDWLLLNGNRINLQRLVSLQKEHGVGDESILGAISDHLTQGKAHIKWRKVAQRANLRILDKPLRPLFPHLPVPAYCDQIWIKWGWQRPLLEARGLSQVPSPDQPATFLFKLRALFGLQARAEIIAWLLAHDSGHPADIARGTSYFRGSIQSVLKDLEETGHFYSVRTGREKRFSVRQDQWRFLLTWKDAGQFPRWVSWAPLFAAIRRVLDLVENPRLAEMSPALQSIELRRALDSALLAKSGHAASFIPSSSGSGSHYLDSTLHALKALLG